jgi:NifU-like protein involved in Fe-S cluster formation
MLDEIYNARILALAADIPLRGRLEAPDASVSHRAKLCGSTIRVDVTTDGRVVTGYAQEVRACALGQAAAAIVGRHVIGSDLQALTAARDAVRCMLAGGEDAEKAVWQEIALLKPVRDYRARHASTLLAFEAAVEAAATAMAARTDASLPGDAALRTGSAGPGGARASSGSP